MAKTTNDFPSLLANNENRSINYFGVMTNQNSNFPQSFSQEPEFDQYQWVWLAGSSEDSFALYDSQTQSLLPGTLCSRNSFRKKILTCLGVLGTVLLLGGSLWYSQKSCLPHPQLLESGRSHLSIPGS